MKKITLCIAKKHLDLINPYFKPKRINVAHEKSNFCIAEYEVASKDILNFFVGKIIELFSSVNISTQEEFITIEVK
jgi:hypothetical protein